MAKKLLVLVGGVFFIFGLLYLAYLTSIQIWGQSAHEWLTKMWGLIRAELVSNGLLLFLAIAILPGLILPVAPLLGLAGLWGGENGPWLSCFYCVLALFGNLSWTYWLARGPARNLLFKILSRTRFSMPESTPKNITEWALILRLTPGVPFIFTNYALGLLGMAFVPYLSVSLPVLAFTACGYVLAFAGIFGGGWKYLWTGSCIIIVSILLGRFFLNRKGKNAD